MNQCHFIGRLVADPEERQTASGVLHLKFRVAVSNGKKNRQTGEWEDDSLFLNCESWEKGAEAIAKHFRKGNRIGLHGELKQENWTDKTTGQKRSTYVLRVEKFNFIDPKNDRIGEAAGRERPAAPVPANDNGPDDNDIPF